ALTAGRTVIDMLANAAFLIGLSLWLAEQDQRWTYALPFERADHGFYRAAQQGLSARLSWPAGHRDQMRTVAAAKLVAELVPAARQGLLRAGVTAAEADTLLGVIATPAASGSAPHLPPPGGITTRSVRWRSCSTATSSAQKPDCPCTPGQSPINRRQTAIHAARSTRRQTYSVIGRG